MAAGPDAFAGRGAGLAALDGAPGDARDGRGRVVRFSPSRGGAGLD